MATISYYKYPGPQRQAPWRPSFPCLLQRSLSQQPPSHLLDIGRYATRMHTYMQATGPLSQLLAVRFLQEWFLEVGLEACMSVSSSVGPAWKATRHVGGVCVFLSCRGWTDRCAGTALNFPEPVCVCSSLHHSSLTCQAEAPPQLPEPRPHGSWWAGQHLDRKAAPPPGSLPSPGCSNADPTAGRPGGQKAGLSCRRRQPTHRQHQRPP